MQEGYYLALRKMGKHNCARYNKEYNGVFPIIVHVTFNNMENQEYNDKKNKYEFKTDKSTWKLKAFDGSNWAWPEKYEYINGPFKNIDELKEIKMLAENEEPMDLSYNPVPPNRTFTVKTKYIFKGKGINNVKE